MERRARRSNHPLEAAGLYLEALAQRRVHTAIALADADGLLLADSNTGLDTEAIAAIAPLAESQMAQGGLLDLVTRGQSVHIWEVAVPELASLYVAAVGGPSGQPEALKTDLTRILS